MSVFIKSCKIEVDSQIFSYFLYRNYLFFPNYPPSSSQRKKKKSDLQEASNICSLKFQNTFYNFWNRFIKVTLLKNKNAVSTAEHSLK